ncbi:MAG TPA: hypothetical protein VHD90_00550 [Phototrophicaceae bacterium]|nr:hypothetical protein [Phototrophicaceae bacterium]
MKRFITFSMILSACALLCACNFFSSPVDLQSENLEVAQDGTQIAAVRATATVNADRLMSTLTGAQTAVGQVDLQSTQIAATLIAQGTLFIDPNVITPAAPPDNNAQSQSPGNTSDIPQIANPLLTPGAPQVNSQGSAQGNSQLTQSTATLPAPAPGNPNNTNSPLSQVELATQVGSDDCAINPTTSFSSSATDIYVVAVANIAAGANLTATFSANGQDVKTYPWKPNFAVHNKCIWFHLPASDVAFTPGNWSVTLTVDGQQIGQPIAFVIGGGQSDQVNTTPQVGG